MKPHHLQNLNPPQYDAVTTLNGPLLILAGAGSGKTRVLTRRIAHLLDTGADPQSLLAVTFTNKAAAEMKERVIELVGEIGEKIWVSTFHSTCCRILREDIEALDIWTRRYAIYDDDDQLRILKDLVNQMGYDPKIVDPRAIRSDIDRRKNNMRSVADEIADHRLRSTEAIARIWQAYDEALQAADALDFNDLIGVTVRLFNEREEVLHKWQERFQYLMVDEYQDTNKGQYELLTLLAKRNRNLAVVGDDDQSIYGFRGADISNILGFERDYPDAKVVRLEQNYRSCGYILAVSNAVVAKNENRIVKRLWTDAPDGHKVNFLVCDTAVDEAKRVAKAVQKLRRHGHPYGDMAIIYRTNATSRLFEQSLTRANVPYRIVGGRKFYERREIRDVLGYLRVVLNPADDAAFLRIVNVPSRGIGAKTLADLREEASQLGQPLLATARVKATGVSRAAKALGSFVSLVDGLIDAALEDLPHALVTRVLDESGYLATLKEDLGDPETAGRRRKGVSPNQAKAALEAKNRLENLEELVRAATAFAQDPPPSVHTPRDLLAAWLDQIALAGAHDDVPDGGEVTLMTVHNAKGLEYPVVFVVQMVDGSFPHAKSRERGLAEERRLAYVAFTRAKERLIVTRAKRMRPPDSAQEKLARPSPFLYGIPLEACTGELPSPDAAVEEGLVNPIKVADAKMAAFMRHRAAPDPEFIEHDHTLIDIEDPSQLERGVKVFHEDRGVGVVRGRTSRMVHVVFGGGPSVRIPLQGGALQLVVD